MATLQPNVGGIYELSFTHFKEPFMMRQHATVQLLSEGPYGKMPAKFKRFTFIQNEQLALHCLNKHETIFCLRHTQKNTF